MNTPHPHTHARELAPPAPPSSCTPYHAQRSRNARGPSGKGQICRFPDAICAAAAHPALTTSPHGHTTRNTAFPPSPSTRPPSTLPPSPPQRSSNKTVGFECRATTGACASSSHLKPTLCQICHGRMCGVKITVISVVMRAKKQRIRRSEGLRWSSWGFLRTGTPNESNPPDENAMI